MAGSTFSSYQHPALSTSSSSAGELSSVSRINLYRPNAEDDVLDSCGNNIPATSSGQSLSHSQQRFELVLPVMDQSTA